jgi:5-methyltetrahydropteroyltriglutamate--homocysteine methyltransferase
VPALRHINVGTYFLELCTPRAGDIEVLKSLPDDRRIGVGVVNQKHERIESVEEIVVKAERAIALFGIDRVLLNPDCGFATFADNPVTSGTIAAKRLAVIAAATQRLRAHRHLAA